MTLPTDPHPSTMKPHQMPPYSLAPLLPPMPVPLLVISLAPTRGGLYCNWTTTMRILKKRRISTEIDTITRIFIREKYYRMNSKFSMNNINMTRRIILMNTCISTKRRNRVKKNENLGTKKTMMTTMITNKMKRRRKSGTIYLTRSFLWTL